MALNCRRVLGLMAVAVALLTSGCPGTETITTGNGNFLIRVDVVNNDPSVFRYDLANVSFGGMTLRPLDPDTDAVLDVSIGAIPGAIDIDLVDPTDQDFSLRLSSGNYRIESVTISNFDPVDFDASGAACDDFNFICGGNTGTGCYPPRFVQAEYRITNFGGDTVLPVEATTDRLMIVTVDAAALMNAFEASFDCLTVGTCSFLQFSSPAPCYDDFDDGMFRGLGPTYISIEIQ